MSDHVSARAVWDGEAVRLLDQDGYRADVKGLKLGTGEALVVRVEREADAYTYAQLKHYWGHVVTPLSEWNGEFKDEWHLRLKLEFMPIDPATGQQKTSLTHLNRDELHDYTMRCEVYAHHAHPEAFLLVNA